MGADRRVIRVARLMRCVVRRPRVAANVVENVASTRRRGPSRWLGEPLEKLSRRHPGPASSDQPRVRTDETALSDQVCAIAALGDSTRR